MKHPNILFMISHDTGKHLGCYGYDVDTPELDNLAKNGVRFDQYFASAPQCSPSRGSILTGLYPHNNGLMGLAHLGFHINKDIETLPMQLQNIGYETSLIGFSHETIGETEEGTYSSTYELGYNEYKKVNGSRAPQVAERTIDFLYEKANNPSSQPFFANVGFWETHRPFDEYSEYKDDLKNIRVPRYLPDTDNTKEDISQFHGSIKLMDESIGKIVDVLKETGLEENTILVYTTDHGIPFPKAKGTLKDAGLETSLIFYNPFLFGRGHTLSNMLCNVDMMPTILDLAGAPIPDNLDGESFAGLLSGNHINTREMFFCELTWHDKYHPMRGIRTNRYKYIKNFEDGPKDYMPVDVHRSLSGKDLQQQIYLPNEPEELYDLYQDPKETNNIIHDSYFEDVTTLLRHQLNKWMNKTQDPLLYGKIPGIRAPEWDEEEERGTSYNQYYYR